MKKKNNMLVAFLLIVSLLNTGVLATEKSGIMGTGKKYGDPILSLIKLREDSTLDDTAHITKLIEIFSHAKIEQLNDYSAEKNDFSDFFYAHTAYGYNVSLFCDRVELERLVLEKVGAQNLWTSVDIRNVEITITGERAQAKAYEQYYYSRVGTPEIISGEGQKYDLKLVKVNDIWYIEDVTTDSPFESDMRLTGISIEEYLEGVKAFDRIDYDPPLYPKIIEDPPDGEEIRDDAILLWHAGLINPLSAARNAARAFVDKEKIMASNKTFFSYVGAVTETVRLLHGDIHSLLWPGQTPFTGYLTSWQLYGWHWVKQLVSED